MVSDTQNCSVHLFHPSAQNLLEKREVWHNIPIQFKFTSRTLQCPLNGTFASNLNHGRISCDVHFAGHLQSNTITSEAIRETYKMCRAGVREDWNWETLPQTHTQSSGQTFLLQRPGSSLGFGALLKGTSVMLLRVEESAVHSLPPTYNPCWNCRLEPVAFGLQVWLSNH